MIGKIETLDIRSLSSRRVHLSNKVSCMSRMLVYKDRLKEFPFNADSVGQVVKDYTDLSMLESQRVYFAEKMAELTDSFSRFQQDVTLLGKKKYSAEDLLSKVSGQYVKSLEDQLNEVYFYVYRNSSRRIRLELTEYRGKLVVDLILTEMVDGVEYDESAEDEGHSVRVVLGTVFLVFFIYQNNLPRELFFDETFGGLSQQSVDRFFVFLKSFSQNLGFSFTFISHDTLRIEQYMDRVYYVKDGQYSLVKEGVV